MKKFNLLFIVALCALLLSSCSQQNDDSEAEDELEQFSTDTAEESATDIEYTAEDTIDSNSEDWDEILDSYEEYVDEYIKLMKQVSAGDMNAYSSLATYTEKLAEFGKKLDAASDDITAAQLARYNKISMKMATAAQ